MSIGLSETQKELSQLARTALKEVCSLEKVSRIYDSYRRNDESHRADLLAIRHALTELGVFGMLLPESAGGLGLSTADAVVFCRDAGYLALPLPVMSSIYVAPILVEEGLADPNEWRSVSQITDEGTAPFSPDADFVIDLADKSLSAVAEVDSLAQTIDWSRPIGRVRTRRVCSDLLSLDVDLFEKLHVAGTLAEMYGLAQRALEMTVEYVVAREQFGSAVGSFQAVKHHLADIKIALTAAEPTLWKAVDAVSDSHAKADLHLASAELLVREAASLTAKLSIQCHGAIGYTTEYPLHILCKRIWALESSLPSIDSVSSKMHAILT